MKQLSSIFAILLTAALAHGQASNSWTQKADFGGTARGGAIGFSIGTKGYLGTGSFTKDFWEYDPDANTWTQKADFVGTARGSAVGFSVGNKGYLGTGYATDGYKKDFWEYDPVANTWTQKADFEGTARAWAVGFSIGSKGYLGTGGNYSTKYKDFWQYDPTLNTWTQQADFGGSPRYIAVGFSIGSKGYLGTGISTSLDKKDFWEYDPDANTWTKKADFGGGVRTGAVGFGIGSKGYLGTGYYPYYKDFWEYDPVANTWTQKSDFGGTARHSAVGCSIGNKGYLGTGYDGTDKKDFWEYTPDGSFCLEPTTLSVTNITSSSAKLNWNSMSGAIGYKVRYKVAGSSEWTNIQSKDIDKTLSGLTASTEYAWQVKSICGALPIIPSAWSEKQFFTTDALRLEAISETTFEVYPNPVSQYATVSFSLNGASSVLMEIMDVNGRSLKVIANTDFPEGSHQVTFHRESLIAGIYLLQLKTHERVMMKKLVFLH